MVCSAGRDGGQTGRGDRHRRTDVRTGEPSTWGESAPSAVGRTFVARIRQLTR